MALFLEKRTAPKIQNVFRARALAMVVELLFILDRLEQESATFPTSLETARNRATKTTTVSLVPALETVAAC